MSQPTDLDALEALNAADDRYRPQPWSYRGWRGRNLRVEGVEDEWVLLDAHAKSVGEADMQSGAEFIVALRNAAPGLLRELRQLREERNQLRSFIRNRAMPLAAEVTFYEPSPIHPFNKRGNELIEQGAKILNGDTEDD